MERVFIAITILLLLVIYNIFVSKRKKEIYKSTLYKKIVKLKIILYIFSALVFILFFIINLSSLGTNPSINEIVVSILNSFSIAILVMPISLETLYSSFFSNEEKYSHIKTIITNRFNKEVISKLNDADINVILLSEEKTNLKVVKEDKVTSKLLLENFQIKTSDLKILDKKVDRGICVKEYKDLNKLYEKIKNSRGIHDNYIRTIKYLIYSNAPILLSYLFIILLGFPVEYNILLSVLLKLFIFLKTRLLYKVLTFDSDIMLRKVKNSNIILGSQENVFLIMECFIITFALTIPYMYFLANGVSISIAFTILIVTFIIINSLLPYYQLNDSSFIKNIFKNIKNMRLNISLLISICMIFIVNFTKLFKTANIQLQNNMACLVISIFTILILELPKIARFSAKRGRRKNEIKNNKK